MRVAFVGKGGAGKSAIAGTFARLLARSGEHVLALDSDPMPGLSYAIGVGLDDGAVPEDAVEENQDEEGPRFRLLSGLSATAAIDQFAAIGPEGVRYLQFGKLRGAPRERARSQAGFSQLLDEVAGQPWSIVGDLPGGTRQPFFGWGRYAETLLVVVEPSAASLLAGKRLARLAAMTGAPSVCAVANKVREPADAVTVQERTGLPLIGAVPYDDAVRDAERRGSPLVDEAPDCPAVAAVRLLVHDLRAGRKHS